MPETFLHKAVGHCRGLPRKYYHRDARVEPPAKTHLCYRPLPLSQGGKRLSVGSGGRDAGDESLPSLLLMRALPPGCRCFLSKTPRNAIEKCWRRHVSASARGRQEDRNKVARAVATYSWLGVFDSYLSVEIFCWFGQLLVGIYLVANNFFFIIFF